MLAITMGDPTGVGPELIVRGLALAQDMGDASVAEVVARAIIFGDAGTLRRAERLSGCRLPAQAQVRSVTDLDQDVAPASADSGRAQVAYLEAAVEAARRGEVTALVTAPIHKASCMAAGFAFPGHTEFLGARLGAGRPVMMLAGPHLRVVPVTTHVALSAVPHVLTAQLIAETAEITLAALCRDFALTRPRLALAALNPHAGEDGHFGDEEERVIRPALRLVEERLRGKMEFELAGPLVPDVVFRQAAKEPFGESRYDCVLAMYHDQGLIPIKLLDFDAAVNVTLGLPIIRTSPDHGVAHDIAWTGRVRSDSFSAALRLAASLERQRFAVAPR